MKKLLNTLYVINPNSYLSLDGENVVVQQEEGQKRVPLHILERIITFGYTGASPALMGKCAEDGRELVFLTSSGRFLARVQGTVNGNVLLRRQQYRTADDADASLKIARNMIAAKLFNSRWVLERMIRDHGPRIDAERFRQKSLLLKEAVSLAAEADSMDTLRGIEGEAATVYFSVLDEMILREKDTFFFHGRNRRPALDCVNAMLNFAYTLMTSMCALCCDRFVLTLINRGMVQKKDFEQQEDGAVLMTDDGRRTFLQAWQKRKDDVIRHPFLEEKVEWGLLPYVQALLLARYLRGDLDTYPPFLWK